MNDKRKDKIDWCMEKNKGISIVEPNVNLASAYTKKAEDALKSMRVNIIKEWKLSTAYYAMYFSLYSILVRIGVKCEIHSCTLEFAEQFLKEYFSEEDIEFLRDSLNARINIQYYINRDVPDVQYQQIIEKAPGMLIKCKNVLLNLNEKKINEIRDKLRRY